MPLYHTLGKIPNKREIQFRKPNGDLYYEQLFGTVGFDGMSTNSYHEQRPTQVKEIRKQYSVAPKIAKENNIKETILAQFFPLKTITKSPKVNKNLIICWISFFVSISGLTE